MGIEIKPFTEGNSRNKEENDTIQWLFTDNL